MSYVQCDVPPAQAYNEIVTTEDGRVPTIHVPQAKAIIKELIANLNTTFVPSMSAVGYKSLVYQLWMVNRRAALKIARARIEGMSGKALIKTINDTRSVIGDALDVLGDTLYNNNADTFDDIVFMSERLVLPDMKTLVMRYILTCEHDVPYKIIIKGVGTRNSTACLHLEYTKMPVGDVPITATEYSVLSQIHH